MKEIIMEIIMKAYQLTEQNIYFLAESFHICSGYKFTEITRKIYY